MNVISINAGTKHRKQQQQQKSNTFDFIGKQYKKNEKKNNHYIPTHIRLSMIRSSLFNWIHLLLAECVFRSSLAVIIITSKILLRSKFRKKNQFFFYFIIKANPSFWAHIQWITIKSVSKFFSFFFFFFFDWMMSAFLSNNKN